MLARDVVGTFDAAVDEFAGRDESTRSGVAAKSGGDLDRFTVLQNPK